MKIPASVGLTLGLLLLVAPAAHGQRQEHTEVRVTTANIKVTLGLQPARADLHKAMQDSDVVLTQEMHNRRIDVTGWGRFQPHLRPICPELATYWRKSVWRFRAGWAVNLLKHPRSFPHSVRCTSIARLQNRITGQVFGFMNGHMIPHVEKGGHPRPLPRVKAYATSMTRMDEVTEHARPTVVAADWNVDCHADARVRWPGFPYAHLHDDYRAACAGAPTLPGRHVDTVWTRGCAVGSVRTIGGTHSDHNFSRVRASCR